MSRIAKKPLNIPKGTEVKISGQNVSAKGSLGTLEMVFHDTVAVSEDNGVLKVSPKSELKTTIAMAGTMRALLNNLLVGVSDGFEKRLTLVGVGYRAQMQGQNVSLSLGFSHPVEFEVPEGVKVECPSQTEIIVRGTDKQLVGQVAANIRSYRPPDPYKGKGVRYLDEYVVKKEAKKK